MSENALDSKGELGRYSTRPNQKLTRQCEWASGILHPWFRVRLNETYSISHNGHKGTYEEDPELCEGTRTKAVILVAMYILEINKHDFNPILHRLILDPDIIFLFRQHWKKI